MPTRSRIPAAALAALATALVTVPALPAASYADTTEQRASCATIEVPTEPLDYGLHAFNGGLPFLMEAGADIDYAANPRVVANAGGAVRTFALAPGHQDLRVHAGVSAQTTMTWTIPLTDGSVCEDSYTAFTYVSADQPHLTYTTPTWGQRFALEEQVLPQFHCGDNGYEVMYCVSNNHGIWYGEPVEWSPVEQQYLDTSTPGKHYVCGFAQDHGWIDGVERHHGTTCTMYRVGTEPVGGDPVRSKIRVQQRDFPSGEWVDLDPTEGVTAGNTVRVRTAYTNTGAKSERIEVDLGADGDPLPEGNFEATIAAGDTYTRDTFLDTKDDAWNVWDSSADLIPVEITHGVHTRFGYQPQTVELTVRPRPLILVHGWKSNAPSSWGDYSSILTKAHPYLRGYAVGDGQFPGKMNTDGGGDPTERTNTIEQNAEQEALYIEAVRKATNSWHVDILAHSMGGLISRKYLQDLMPEEADGRPVVNRLIQMGTPNMGSQLADLMMAFGAAGVQNIPFYPASYHLTPGYVDGIFNRTVTRLHGVPVSNLVGTQLPLVGMPLRYDLTGDGIVPAYSARWTLADTQDAPYDFHTVMTESADDFRNYVQPRLAKPVTGVLERRAMAASAASSAALPDDTQVSATKSVIVPAGASIEVPFTIEAADEVGVLAVDRDVRLQLRDHDGNVLNDSQHEGEEVTEVRTEGVQAQQGSVVVTSTAGAERRIDLLFFASGSALTLDSAVTGTRAQGLVADGREVLLTAALREEGTPVTGATLTARVTTTPEGERIALHDDGTHGDRAAGDGVHSASVTLPVGDHLAVLEATSLQGRRISSQVLSVLPDGSIPEAGPVGAYTLEVLTDRDDDTGDASGEVTRSPEKAAYGRGETVRLTAVPAAGSRFDHWTVNGVRQPAGERAGELTVTMREDTWVVATFSEKPATEEPADNNAPTLDAGALTTGVTLVEGEELTGSVTVVDPDAGDAWSATVDYGDGAQRVVVTGGTIALQRRYPQDGSQAVTVAVTDAAGASATIAIPVTVTNAAPVPVLNGPAKVEVVQGGTVTVTGRLTDAGVQDTQTGRVTFGSAASATVVDATVTPVAGRPGEAVVRAEQPMTTVGTFAVELAVTDSDGALGRTSSVAGESMTVTVTAAPASNPTQKVLDGFDAVVKAKAVKSGIAKPLRALVAQAGWYAEHKQAAQAKATLMVYRARVALARIARQLDAAQAKALDDYAATAAKTLGLRLK